jgi:capsule polysaccharide export protein KpsE/RkpR
MVALRSTHFLANRFPTFAHLFGGLIRSALQYFRFFPELKLTAPPLIFDFDMSNHDNLLGVLGTIYRWRKALRNVCLVALLGSIGIALWMDTYFKATTIFYPSNQDLSKPELIFGGGMKVTEYFGTDRDVDRLLEIAASNELVDYMLNTFQLFQHYGIDSASQEGRYWARLNFRDLYAVQKNRNDAIELSIEDTDPALAAEMANAARKKIDEIAQRLTKSSQSQLLASFDANIKRKTSELLRLGDSLRTIQSKYNIYSGGFQGEQLSEQLSRAEEDIARNRARLEVLDGNPHIPLDTIEYIKANLRGAMRQRQSLLSHNPNNGPLSIRDYNEGIGQVSIANDLHNQARKQLSYDMERYNQILAAYNTDIPALQIVELAEAPMMKSRPKRSIIVIGAVLAAFFFTLFAAFLADAYRDVNWKALNNG